MDPGRYEDGGGIQVRGNWKDYIDIHTLVSHGVDVATGLAQRKRSIGISIRAISIRALQFMETGALDRVPGGMQRDLTHWPRRLIRANCQS